MSTLSLTDAFAVHIARGLRRSGIKSASKWAESYRVMGGEVPGKWTFDRHPWLLEMHDATERKIIGQKAAQMGYTEWAMNMAFFHMDVHNQDVLYVLPTSDDASDFTAARFDPALEMSPHLRDFFGSVNNVGLKRGGNSILYVRGSHSRSKLKSIPAPIMIWDEVDEMPKGSLALGEERQSGQSDYRTMMLSTPSTEDKGINREFKTSTQEHYHFKCPSCSRFITLEYPDCLVMGADSLTDPKLKETHLICTKCENKLPNETKQEWLKPVSRGGTAQFVAKHPDREARGLHISQLFSMAGKCSPPMIAEAVLKAQYDPTRAQELHNSKLGLCYAAEGAKITDTMIEEVLREYLKGPRNFDYVTMGVDVGAVLHIVIKGWTHIGTWRPGLSINDQYRPTILFEGESSGSADDFDEASALFDEYKCDSAVIDAEPERRMALQWAQRHYGSIMLCDYLFSQSGRQLAVNEDELLIKCNRTSWLDVSLGRYKSDGIDLPKDTSEMFKNHIKSPVRVLSEDRFGNPVAIYENATADHFAHADVYGELALPLAVGKGTTQTIASLV